jgi:hypothetical protein
MRKKTTQRIIKICMAFALVGTMLVSAQTLAAQAFIPAMGAASISFGSTSYTGNSGVSIQLYRATPTLSSSKPIYAFVRKEKNPTSTKVSNEVKYTAAQTTKKSAYKSSYTNPSTFYVHARTTSAWTTGTTAMLYWTEY